MADEVYGLNSGDCDAVLKMIGKTPQPASPFETDDSTRLVLAYTTAGATGRSGTTLGKGTATMRYLAVSGADRVLTATTDTADIDFFNLSTEAVGTNRYIVLLRAGADLLCNWEDCV